MGISGVVETEFEVIVTRTQAILFDLHSRVASALTAMEPTDVTATFLWSFSNRALREKAQKLLTRTDITAWTEQ